MEEGKSGSSEVHEVHDNWVHDSWVHDSWVYDAPRVHDHGARVPHGAGSLGVRRTPLHPCSKQHPNDHRCLNIH